MLLAAVSSPEARRRHRRYRCTACGNVTRFTVTARVRTRAFHHFTLGGELAVEDEEVLEAAVEDVACRWCDSSASIEEIEDVEEVEEVEGAGGLI